MLRGDAAPCAGFSAGATLSHMTHEPKLAPPLHALLELGTVLGVGEGSSFGCGRYELWVAPAGAPQFD